MNKRYVLDAYAWIEYFSGSKAGMKVREILDCEAAEAYTCAVTISEVVSKSIRSDKDPEVAYDVIVGDSNVLDVDDVLSKKAGSLHAQVRSSARGFGLADAYVLACARYLDATIVTGDPHFEGFKEALLIR